MPKDRHCGAMAYNRTSRGCQPEATRADLRKQAARTVKGRLRVAVCGQAEAGDALSRPRPRAEAIAAPANAIGAQIVQALQTQGVQVRQAARVTAEAVRVSEWEHGLLRTFRNYRRAMSRLAHQEKHSSQPQHGVHSMQASVPMARV